MLSKENRDKVLNGLSFQKPEMKTETEITKQKQEEIKPTIDKTEKYIELLKDGLIDKQEFLKLIGVEQVKKNSDIIGYL